MALPNYIRQETNLTGEIVNANVAAAGLEIQVAFVDKKTGEARTPQDTTLQFVINKDNSKFEIIRAESHVTADGVTTITVKADGRKIPSFGSGSGAAIGNSHNIGDSVSCVYTADQVNNIIEVLEGNFATGASELKLGTEANGDITITFENGEANKPFLKWDQAQSKLLFSNNGVDVLAIGTGGGDIQSGGGTTVDGGVLNINLGDETTFTTDGGAGNEGLAVVTDENGLIDPSLLPYEFVTSSAGAADAGKAVLLNGSGELDGSFIPEDLVSFQPARHAFDLVFDPNNDNGAHTQVLEGVTRGAFYNGTRQLVFSLGTSVEPIDCQANNQSPHLMGVTGAATPVDFRTIINPINIGAGKSIIVDIKRMITSPLQYTASGSTRGFRARYRIYGHNEDGSIDFNNVKYDSGVLGNDRNLDTVEGSPIRLATGHGSNVVTIEDGDFVAQTTQLTFDIGDVTGKENIPIQVNTTLVSNTDINGDLTEANTTLVDAIVQGANNFLGCRMFLFGDIVGNTHGLYTAQGIPQITFTCEQLETTFYFGYAYLGSRNFAGVVRGRNPDGTYQLQTTGSFPLLGEVGAPVFINPVNGEVTTKYNDTLINQTADVFTSSSSNNLLEQHKANSIGNFTKNRKDKHVKGIRIGTITSPNVCTLQKYPYNFMPDEINSYSGVFGSTDMFAQIAFNDGRQLTSDQRRQRCNVNTEFAMAPTGGLIPVSPIQFNSGGEFRPIRSSDGYDSPYLMKLDNFACTLVKLEQEDNPFFRYLPVTFRFNNIS